MSHLSKAGRGVQSTIRRLRQSQKAGARIAPAQRLAAAWRWATGARPGGNAIATVQSSDAVKVITVRTTGNDKIDSISLTDKGCLAAQGIVFSHQERMQGV